MSVKATTTAAVQGEKPVSVMQRRWRKFRTLKRGYYSLVALVSLYVLSFFLPLLVNSKALLVSYQGETYMPALGDSFIGALFGVNDYYPASEFGQQKEGECNYRQLQVELEAKGGSDYVVMPFYPYDPIEDISTAGNEPFAAPFEDRNGGGARLLGTDDRGRDVFARMAYGFQVSITFAIVLAVLQFAIGIPLGGMLGYFGGKVDILGQRLIEIWAALPSLFLIIIIVSLIRPTMLLFIVLLTIVGWVPMTTLMRAEFYRERSKDYVAAAISIGVPTWKILLKHILPNALVPVITFLPFAIVGGISSLVSLDFLGFGLPPPTPSWGQMVSVGLQHYTKWWLAAVPLSAMFFTLLMVVFIGEGIREAFDPKVYSRMR